MAMVSSVRSLLGLEYTTRPLGDALAAAAAGAGAVVGFGAAVAAAWGAADVGAAGATVVGFGAAVAAAGADGAGLEQAARSEAPRLVAVASPPRVSAERSKRRRDRK